MSHSSTGKTLFILDWVFWLVGTTLSDILYKKFVEHHVIKLILLKISKLSAHLTQAIIRDKLQRLKHTQDICTRQLITCN